MHVFISAGEPSGDLHGSSLIRALLEREPSAQIVGFGGDRMQAASANLLYPLAKHSVMGVTAALANLRTFLQLGDKAERYFKTQRPDAVVLIDYPGFHLPLATRARNAGIPVYYFVPPQIWGWKTWRVKKVRRDFTAVLTALPFEDDWYRSRHVRTQYVGHPYFDELASQRLDDAFLHEQRSRPGPILALLPGSRNQEVKWNATLILDSARRIHAERPDVRFLVAAFNEHQSQMLSERGQAYQLPLEIHVGRTPEIIELATACLAVSGSVSLEMMSRAKPAVVVYQVKAFTKWLIKQLVRVKYISLVNLLADAPVYPEFPTSVDDSPAIAAHLLRWLNDPAALAATVEQLRTLKERTAVPGACERAAQFLVEAVRIRRTLRSAA